jgi:hypothetical protein
LGRGKHPIGGIRINGDSLPRSSSS